jgi:hypothetical protein
MHALNRVVEKQMAAWAWARPSVARFIRSTKTRVA